MRAFFDESFDVVVIGAGIAGLSAAVAAAEAGARVAILERACEDEFGGNTRWTEAYFRMKSEDEISDDFEQRLADNAGHHLDPYVVEQMSHPYEDWPPFVKAHGLPDPELISTLATLASPTVKWLKAFGVRFATLPTYFITAAAPRLMPVGGGLALIEALLKQALARSARIFYRVAAYDMERAPDGWLVISCTAPQGSLRLASPSVVVASGGFEGNPEMLAQYMGRTARHIRPVARGGYLNRGEGIRIALKAGAASAGDFSAYHAEPLDPRSARPEPLVMNFPYGILVNQDANRFVDEAPGPVDVHYDHISREIADQPEGIAYVIYDQAIDDVPNWKRSIRTEQPPIMGDSIASLAEKLGLDPDRLIATIEEYNGACAGGQFKPLEVDGVATRGLRPNKSNWARPIRTAPYCAYPIISGICFTYGGVKTNKRAEVVDGDGRPIAGLFAAGEAAGLYYQVYTGATSVLRGAVFGKCAGEGAAAFAALRGPALPPSGTDAP